MTTSIQLFSKDLELKTLETVLLPITETSIKIHDLIVDDGMYLIRVWHSNLNTLVDFSKSKSYQLINFDDDKNFTGASYATTNAKGNFILQTQSKWILIIPLEKRLDQDVMSSISNFEIHIHEDQKAAVLQKLKEEFPITPYTSVGRLSTTLWRMKAEQQLNLPISWRVGSAISVTSGKRASEMQQDEWNAFFEDLCDTLKQNYPSKYESLFPLA
ncbi:hypothetical protein [uncultured Gelidibacter sp.]|uniref:hypothetical protein n=1 Tax=uncultured Gelidibacter sp. TaxID=259318 RepID=UPI0026084E56|nr:hypothetical protein [uncultured Gelidibacter sp.]